ncbi:glycosyltransferase family 10 domain-containing protein [Pseudomonas marginalis]|uniref:glycosyltransferase family 10 domain-containing protein n=1 Tax=Pseudomonas marginalis TaxID=298 RepID=UPI000A604C18|nr:glycosyltransferase family 10 [Pseudomonas marginalis]
MKVAILRAPGMSNNVIFDLDSPQNRDNCFAPYVLLRQKLLENNIQLNTADLAAQKIVDFELHQDVQLQSSAAVNYLMLFETKFIKPENGDLEAFSRYRKIFTWDERLIDNERFIKINFPNELRFNEIDGWAHRDRFCCLISSNRALTRPDTADLYIERVTAIRWFEKNAPEDFDLYGIDWNQPAARGGYIGKIQRRLWPTMNRILRSTPFPSYRGRVDSKDAVLKKTKFSICYENVKGLPGYITEKIFDCFFAGCVPVYWGANDITDHIPADCFIDRRKFTEMSDLYNFLKSMTESEYTDYQQRISNFLQSSKAYPFSSSFFAETVANTVVNDLGR